MKKTIMITLVLGFGLILAVQAAWAACGKAEFDAKCASCHGADGKGKAAMAGVFKVDAAKLDVTDNDAAGCVKVVTNGQGTMKPVSSLDAACVQELCNYSNSL